MSDKETKERIDDRVFSHPSMHEAQSVGTFVPLTPEEFAEVLRQQRNEVLDEVIELFRSVPWDQNIIALIEQLKHKQP